VADGRDIDGVWDALLVEPLVEASRLIREGRGVPVRDKRCGEVARDVMDNIGFLDPGFVHTEVRPSAEAEEIVEE